MQWGSVGVASKGSSERRTGWRRRNPSLVAMYVGLLAVSDDNYA